MLNCKLDWYLLCYWQLRQMPRLPINLHLAPRIGCIAAASAFHQHNQHSSSKGATMKFMKLVQFNSVEIKGNLEEAAVLMESGVVSKMRMETLVAILMFSKKLNI